MLRKIRDRYWVLEIKITMKNIAPLFLILLLVSCTTPNKMEEEKKYETSGQIERLDQALDNIVATDATIEVLTDGFNWSEGPLWIKEKEMLIFSDVPENKIYKWSEEAGLSVFLEPSGFTGEITNSNESGSNGLALNPQGALILCQHGDRRVAQFIGDMDAPKPEFKTIADQYEGKRFNSPNDLVFDKQGNLYFTDPPYGLSVASDDAPEKELPFQGVFQLKTNGELVLITDSLSRPNGIALAPDGRTLYVANSDPNRAIWMQFPIDENNNVGEGSLFYDATAKTRTEAGLPDGLKVNKEGILFATGPGGVWIFSPDSKVLGKIKPGQLVSNCALDDKEEVLYLTADDYLMRVKF